VTDIAKAAKLVEENGKKGEVYNACSGDETRINWLVNEISYRMGYTGKVTYERGRAGDVTRHQGDNTKIICLGWKPSVSIREAIDRTVEWYK
jgi:nucleoside-diphosphate-sugar epimerase